MRKLVLYLLPFTLIFSVCAKAEKADIQKGDYPQAPDFAVKDLKGNEISLSDLEGKIVFLNFWATWCPPCRHEIPGFVEMYQEYKDNGMEIIGISVDRIGSASVLKFAEKYKINYPVVMGTKKIVRDYEPGRAIPITIIIDQDGKIRHRHIGYMDKDTLKNYFLELAKEK